jgi:osmotically-inducible protein OsmY
MIGAIAAALSLAACGDNREDASVSRSDTNTTTSSATATDRMTADASAAANRAGQTASDATSRAGTAAQSAGDKAANTASDAATTAKVKSRLMAEPGIDSLQIDVDTNNGRVTLSGEADTAQNKARAAELARSIEGVTGVNDRLTVKK